MSYPVSPYFTKSKDNRVESRSSMVMAGILDEYRYNTPTTTEVEDGVQQEKIDSDIETVKPFPKTNTERAKFINFKTNRTVTEFQFRVYDLCSQIPSGWFSTYKAISDALHSSPRAVGQALKNNPFAPLPIPCHRVLSGNYFIGGFEGDWGSGNKINSKKAKLEKEGLQFDEQQVLLPVFQNTRFFNDFKLN